MNERDAVGFGVFWAFWFVRGALQMHFPGVGRKIAAEDIHECGFAGPVFADEPDSAGGWDGEGNSAQNFDAEEGFVDVDEFEERRAHGVLRPQRWRSASRVAARRMPQPLVMVMANCERLRRLRALSSA